MTLGITNGGSIRRWDDVETIATKLRRLQLKWLDKNGTCMCLCYVCVCVGVCV